jgi:ubiquinone/menaquinone biosynthesis C-methylase UbiE
VTQAATIDEVLGWEPEELRRIRSLLAMRRFWMTELYPRLRHRYDDAVRSMPDAPRDLHEARPVVEQLDGIRYFLWLDRYIQLRLWEEVGRMVDDRLRSNPELLDPVDDDLGQLRLDPSFDQPDYYAEYDFHRQDGGIWRDDRGALVYAMGARVIHVNSKQPYVLHQRLAGDVPAEQPGRVLDLGCGFGKTTFFLKERWPEAEVVGVDLSAPVLRLARKMATDRGLAIEWRQADIEHLPDPDDSYDVVTLSMVLHELPMASIEASVKEALRVLKPGGVFVGLETRLTGDPLRDLLGAYHSEITGEPYINAFRGRPFAQFAESAGFAEVSVHEWSPTGTVMEPTADTWATPWALLVARKGN